MRNEHICGNRQENHTIQYYDIYLYTEWRVMIIIKYNIFLFIVICVVRVPQRIFRWLGHQSRCNNHNSNNDNDNNNNDDIV